LSVLRDSPSILYIRRSPRATRQIFPPPDRFVT
jgi:hypothetical protein